MFTKILVANRGEIACRIIKTAKKLGIETVAVYSSIDKESLHVRNADYAYWIGEAPAKDSYLNIEAIIEAAILSKAEAIHPGYGFLSENPDFCRAVTQAGLVFIGPPLEALEIMASKQRAKQALESTSVPLIPGYHGQEQADDYLLKQAKSLGFPLLIKPANGGGGKGMRIISKEKDFLTALSSARREALASFADDTMILEKFLQNPRHIEVQIMSDNFGSTVHLFERDCSIQRRHQKIIEEAPAPNLAAGLKDKLRLAACEVANSIAYRGAGTVEFLVEKDEIYFIEMNTRLQVEHPVTEMITKLDLVEWQLKIAANQALPLKQEQIKAKGHAIECRIYAEDSQQQFIPSTGKISFLKTPESANIRIDSGIKEGSEISQYYDPMIAKLIAYGETREQALASMQQALKAYAIGGIKTNIYFLQTICSQPNFAKAKFGINFLDEEKLVEPHPDLNLALLFAVGFDYLALTAKLEDPIKQAAFAWQMHLQACWTWSYLIKEQKESLDIRPISKSEFYINNQKLSAKFKSNRLYLTDNIKQISAWVEPTAAGLRVYLEDAIICLKPYRWQDLARNEPINTELRAPMPATVVSVLKKIGDHIKKGEQLMVLEAMKMEHSIHAPVAGILSEIYFNKGEQVQEGAELLALSEDSK